MTFSAAGIGPATITVQNPPGYTAPTDGSKTVQVTVADGGCLAGNITVGRNLETTMRVGLNGIAPPGGVSMTVTSNDPSKLRFSKTSAGAGAAAITLSLPENAGASPEFSVDGLASSGTATYTAQASGFGQCTGTVTFAPSGIVFANSSGGQTTPLLLTPAAGPRPLLSTRRC